MKVSGIVANLLVADIEAASDFYTEYLGLSAEGFNMGWVAHYQSPDGKVALRTSAGRAVRESTLDARRTGMCPTESAYVDRP